MYILAGMLSTYLNVLVSLLSYCCTLSLLLLSLQIFLVYKQFVEINNHKFNGVKFDYISFTV